MEMPSKECEMPKPKRGGARKDGKHLIRRTIAKRTKYC